MKDRGPIRAALARPTVVRFAVLVGVLLACPSLFFGFAMDDRLQRQTALGQSKLYELGPLNLFAFVPGDPTRTLGLMDRGFGAWWSDVHARIVLLRPISSGLMWLDYNYLEHPVAIHAHSVLWFALTIALAGKLYQRWIEPPWVAGLAALMFAVDPTHGLLVGWIAQRNGLIAGAFGLLALLLHDRARREQRVAPAVGASLCLGLGLFSAEAALGVLPYLLAYAWFLDQRKLRSLLPFAPPLLLWACVYKLGDYGAQGSGLYVDPLHQPLLFAQHVVTHGPMLLAAEIGLLGPDFYLVLSPWQQVAVVVASVVVLAAFAVAIAPLFVRDKVTRFFVVGALLSVVPSCATFPSGRLLFFASFGVVGALAQLFAAWRDRSALRSRWAGPLVYFAAPFHVYLAPVLLVAATTQMLVLDRVLMRTSEGVPNVPELDTQRLVVINSPDATFLGYLAPIRVERGEHTPDKVLAMASGVRPLALTRTSETSLTLSSPVALVQPGTDLLVRDERPFEVGHRVVFTDVAIEITAVNADGWPTEARFDFARPLEDPSLRFMQWSDQTLTALTLPSVGERLEFPAQQVQLF